MWYNFLCLHDKKFHDKYLTMFPWYQKVINRESSREGYLSPILPAMEASPIFWVLQHSTIFWVLQYSTSSSTQRWKYLLTRSFKFTLFHCLWNILLWEIQQLCQIILSLPQLQITTTVSNICIAATTSNYEKPFLLRLLQHQ